MKLRIFATKIKKIMKENNLLDLFKYYKGEERNPNKPNTDEALWWEGEKVFFDTCSQDKDFFSRTKGLLQDAIDNKSVNGSLADSQIDLNKRTIIFFLDLWHGKWYPYDDLDRIFTY